jgi:hypothetical protein
VFVPPTSTPTRSIFCAIKLLIVPLLSSQRLQRYEIDVDLKEKDVIWRGGQTFCSFANTDKIPTCAIL